MDECNKVCRTCSKIKKITEYYKEKNYKDGTLPNCIACVSEKHRKYRISNPDKIKLANTLYSLNNKEKINNSNKRHYHKNNKKINKKRRKDYLKNIEKRKEQGRLYRTENREKECKRHAKYMAEKTESYKASQKKYRSNHPEKGSAAAASRRAKKLLATPIWLTIEQLVEISALYLKAKILSKNTGIKHHVDHIAPLQGKNVRGLHVPWNLQILTAEENIRKSNKF